MRKKNRSIRITRKIPNKAAACFNYEEVIDDKGISAGNVIMPSVIIRGIAE